MRYLALALGAPLIMLGLLVGLFAWVSHVENLPGGIGSYPWAFIGVAVGMTALWSAGEAVAEWLVDRGLR